MLSKSTVIDLDTGQQNDMSVRAAVHFRVRHDAEARTRRDLGKNPPVESPASQKSSLVSAGADSHACWTRSLSKGTTEALPQQLRIPTSPSH